MVTKNCEICGISYKDCKCFLEYTDFKDDLIECKCLYCNQNYRKKFDGLTYKYFLTSTSLFYRYEKVFAYMNIWMIGENSMKHHYLKKRLLQSPKHGRYY